MKKRINTEKAVFNKLVFILILLFFGITIYRVGVLSLSTTIDGTNLSMFASNRNTSKEVIYAKRGTIYDSENNILAQTVNSYTVIAFLDSSRSKGYKNPQHVIDKKKTAESLSPIINMTEEAILKLLNREAYQVELGPGGRGITEITKEKIDALNLPGISFTSSYKRYYPNGEFLSYVLGYVQTTEDGSMVGEMGIEQKYDDILRGTNGVYEYQQDLNGYKISGTPEIRKEAVDGVDIHLTIDTNIQLFAERYTKAAYEKYSPEWAIAVVADAKTGAILASTSYPSFDPNIKNIPNYLNPLISSAYEPGSTMKTYTYMSIMESGRYDGTKEFLSGSVYFGKTIISDWQPKGWGMLTYDQGFALSANTGASSLVKNYSSTTELREYFEKLGFGKTTGIELSGEEPGKLKFKYAIELATAAFGQGITTTPIQNIKALTAVSNNGILLKPFIVTSIVNKNTREIEYSGIKTSLGRVASIDTITKIKELMYNTVNGPTDVSTGSLFKQDGYEVIAKTGTAQYTNPYTGEYYFDDVNYIRSFAGMFPYDDPKYIVYVAIKRPYGKTSSVSDIVNPLIKDIANYKGIYTNTDILEDFKEYSMPNLLNKTLEYSTEYLKDKALDITIIGKGNKVINQYPKVGININKKDKIYLVTDTIYTELPDLKSWSLKEVTILCNLLGFKLEYTGSGFVYEQDINLKTKKIIIKLENDIDIEEEKEDVTEEDSV